MSVNCFKFTLSLYFSFSGCIIVADKSVQLPTGSANIISLLFASWRCAIASENPPKLQQKQLPLTSSTISLLVSKNDVSTNSLAWSLVINPTLRPFKFKRFATSHKRLVFPAPKKPPTKIKSVFVWHINSLL